MRRTRALRFLDGLHILQKYLRPTYHRDVSRVGRWSIQYKVASITPDSDNASPHRGMNRDDRLSHRPDRMHDRKTASRLW